MIKKLSLLTMKILFGVAMYEHSVLALVLNGKEVEFNHAPKDSTTKSVRVLGDRYKTIIAKFNSPLTNSDKESLYEVGVNSIIYAGDLSYYLYAKESTLNSIDFDKYDFVGKSEMRGEYRFKDDSGLITLSQQEYQTFNILFLEELNLDEVQSYLDSFGIEAKVLRALPELREAKVKVATRDLEKLKSLELIQYMDRSQSMKTVHGNRVSRNYITAKNIDVTRLWLDDYNLHGENMSVGVVDGGVVRSTHQEFNKDGCSRVINRSNLETNFHATHVAGTIGADGDLKSARGMANRVTIYSYGFSDVSFAESFLKLYQNDGVLFSNHSYGYNDKIRLGEYDSDASTQDKAVSNNPYINVFEAAGNDGKDPNYADFGIIKGPGNSKNIFTIGALDITSSSVATLSSTGPVRDGRIKPDLCVRGEYIRSSSDESDSSYATMSGTSMATPAATGAGLLVAQQYKRTTGGFDIRHDLLKSILVNTAVDKENRGPDYKVGFGMIDTKKAVDVVKSISSDKSLVASSSVGHNQKRVYELFMPKSGHFKATLSWVDIESNPSSSVTLVNDLDMLLINSDTGKVYYPYTLDKNNPNALAKADKPNRVDNIEQIEVNNLPSGNYKIEVSGYRVISNTQEFAIVSNIPISGDNDIEKLRESKLKCFAKIMHRGIL